MRLYISALIFVLCSTSVTAQTLFNSDWHFLRIEQESTMQDEFSKAEFASRTTLNHQPLWRHAMSWGSWSQMQSSNGITQRG